MNSHIILGTNVRLTSSTRSKTVIILSLFVFFATTTFLPQYIIGQKAYADGVSVENLPPTIVGNRQLSLYVKVNPPILTTAASHSAYMQFRFFDVKNNQSIQDVTYVITVTRGTASSGRPLLLDFFHTQNGLLTLHIEPNPGLMAIYGKQDPFLNAWVADPGGNILVRGPLLLQGGLYHFHVVIIIDNDKSLFIPQQAPKFDAYLSVGSVYDKNAMYHNHNYNTTLISYYEQVNNLNFNPSTPMFTWSMPFDYNMTRIKQQPIFVHEEMRLPKSWKGFGDLTQFNATVNGQRLSGGSLAIDPFSFPNDTVVHYLVNKNDIIKLAQDYNGNHTKNVATTTGTGAGTGGAPKSENTTGPMNFALTPFTGVTQISTSSDIPTNTGSIHAAVSWSPNPIAPNTQSTLHISFYDPTGIAPLTNTNVKYNLTIYDKNNHPVITKKNLLATNAAGTETIVFPAAQTYHMQVQITGLFKPGQTPDFTRNGVATGYVVVPEFPGVLSASLIMALMIGMTLLIRSRKNISRWGLY
jgi:hypothetical protein